MLNNDAVATPDWIRVLRRAAETGGSRLGMIQSRILFKHDPGLINSTGVLIYRDGLFIDRAYQKPVVEGEVPEEIFCGSAGACLYRRAMLDEIRLETGVFDRGFFMYFEDVDLGWRARLAGWSASYEPDATVYHAFHGTSSRRGKNFVRLQCGKNRLRTVLKNGSMTYIAASTRRIFADFVWSIGKEGPRVFFEYFAATMSGLAQRGSVAKLARSPRRMIELDWVADGGRLASPRENG
jgi:GT2 family glycosyltransferase